MDRLVKNALFITVFITPALFTIGLSENFEFTKTYFLIIVVSIFLMLGVLKTKVIKLNRLDIILLLFVLVYLLSSLFSYSFISSVFGHFNLYSENFLFLLVVTVFLIITKEELLKLGPDFLNRLVLYSSVFVVIYSTLQFLNLDFLKWGDDINRVFSTFGQPNLLSQYLGVVMLICFYYLVERGVRKIFFYSLIVFVCLLLTQSLSTYFSIVLTFIIYLFLRFKYLDKRYFSVFFVSVFLILLISLPLYFNRLVSQLNSGFNNGTFITNDTGRVRLILYSGVIENLKDVSFKRILIGSGPETFADVFLRPTKIYTTSNWDTLFVKPHNFYLEELFEIGIVGVLFYVFIFYVSVAKAKKDFIFLIPTFILINSLFFWPPSYLLYIALLFFYLGVLLRSKYLNKTVLKFKTNKSLRFLFFSLIFLIFTLSTVYIFSFLSYKNYPCLSYKLISKNKHYLVSCKIHNKTSIDVDKFLLKDKIASETAFNYLVINYPDKALTIIDFLIAKEPTNPIYLYYKGYYFERVGMSDLALEYYLKSKVGIGDFYAVDEAINRLKSSF